MAKRQVKISAESVIVELFIQDATSVAGAGLAGLLFNSAGLTCYFKRNKDAAATAVPLVDIPTLGAFVSGGFKSVSATNMPGVYEFHIPDAAFVAGSETVSIMLQGAANMVPVTLEIELVAEDPQTGVRLAPIIHTDANIPFVTQVGVVEFVREMQQDALDQIADAMEQKFRIYAEVLNPAVIPGPSQLQFAGVPTADDLKGTKVVIRNLLQQVAQVRTIIAYDSGTRTITVDRPWSPTPTDGDILFIYFFGFDLDHSTQALNVWKVQDSSVNDAGSLGVRLKENIDAPVSSRADAADYTPVRAAGLDNLDSQVSAVAADAAGNVWNTDPNTFQLTPTTMAHYLLKSIPPRLVKGEAFPNFTFLMTASDGRTPKTGLTAFDFVEITKGGGTLGPVDNPVITEIGRGLYALNLTANDTNADVFTLVIGAAGAMPRYITVVTHPYDETVARPE